jgi:hypothetical protein
MKILNIKGVILLSLFIINTDTFSQNIKTYNGTYEKGKAIYQYYENSTGERVYHGKFEYKCEDYGDNYPFQSIEGTYSNGEKIGFWSYIYESRLQDFISTIKKHMSYTKNILNGEYFDEQYFTVVKNGLSTKTINHKNKFYYRNGKPFGQFIFERIYPFPSIYKGTIDSLGYTDGVWQIKDEFIGSVSSDQLNGKFEANIEYKNGRLLKRHIIYTETGKVIENYTATNYQQIADTTFYKTTFVNYKHISCCEIGDNGCPFFNKDIHEKISKNIPFDFSTKHIEYQISNYGTTTYKELVDTFNYNKKKYFKLLSGIALNYSGKLIGIKTEPTNQYAKKLRIDTSANILALNNTTNEILYKLYLVNSLYKFAFTEQGNPQDRILNAINGDDNYRLLSNESVTITPENFFNEIKVYTYSLNKIYNDYLSKIDVLLKNIFDKETRLEIVRNKCSKILDLEEAFEKESYLLDSKYNSARQVRILKKNYSVDNIYLIPLYENLKNKLDNYTVELKANGLKINRFSQEIPDNNDALQKLNDRLNITKKRDSLFIKTIAILNYVPEISCIIEKNKGKSSVENGLIKSNSDELDIINPTFFKRIYSIYIPETLEQISKTDKPENVIILFKEIETILKKVENEAKNNNEVFAKELKKTKNKQEILNLTIN